MICLAVLRFRRAAGLVLGVLDGACGGASGASHRVGQGAASARLRAIVASPSARHDGAGAHRLETMVGRHPGDAARELGLFGRTLVGYRGPP
jgi:hypothetical protein